MVPLGSEDGATVQSGQVLGWEDGPLGEVAVFGIGPTVVDVVPGGDHETGRALADLAHHICLARGGCTPVPHDGERVRGSWSSSRRHLGRTVSPEEIGRAQQDAVAVGTRGGERELGPPLVLSRSADGDRRAGACDLIGGGAHPVGHRAPDRSGRRLRTVRAPGQSGRVGHHLGHIRVAEQMRGVGGRRCRSTGPSCCRYRGDDSDGNCSRQPSS